VHWPFTAVVIRTVAAATVVEGLALLPAPEPLVVRAGIATTQLPTFSALALVATCWLKVVALVHETAT
jgi:hypothetical protein